MKAAWQRLSLRARLLLIGLVGLAAALAIGSASLYGILTLFSYRHLDESNAATAADVATLVDRGRLPDPIPVTGAQIVQVVDARGRVISASVNADRLTALMPPRELNKIVSSGSPGDVPGSRMGLGSGLRVMAVRAGPSEARVTVVTAQQSADIVHSQRVLGLTLLATFPLLLAALGLIAWRVMGAALRPVEELRASAERISGTEQDSRLPVPRSHDEIHALAVTLNSMLDRLAASRARQRSFVADAAHELRSPLATMQTELDVSHRLGEGTPMTEDLRAEVARMTSLVEDLLLLARLDATGPVQADAEAVDLHALSHELVDRYRHAPVPLVIGEMGTFTVWARRDDLRRAVTNLVDNAVRHARSLVEISASDEDGRVVLDVSDDGCGMTAADRERVFERFTRLDDARSRDAGGSGLGLSIVKELVSRNGGQVRLAESTSGGTSAQIVLPAAGGGRARLQRPAEA